MNATARCPVCDEELPARGHPHGGRKARYCSSACKAKAYRERRQADNSPAPDRPPLPDGARHARAIEIRQQATDLIAALADTASGQQALFATPASARRTRPAEAARTLHHLTTELAALATAAVVTKRAPKLRPTETSLLFDGRDLNDGRHHPIVSSAPASGRHSDSSDI